MSNAVPAAAQRSRRGLFRRTRKASYEREDIANYRRSLDLATAIHTVSYKSGSVTFRREAFASHPDGVMALRFSADRPASCTAAVTLKGAHKETTQAAENTLTFAGVLDNGLKYETKLVALNDGGTLQAGDGKLEFQNCNSVTLLLAAGTDYAHGLRPPLPRRRPARRPSSSGSPPRREKVTTTLKAAHIADYQSLFNRVALDVGTTPADRRALPIDQRKVVPCARRAATRNWRRCCSSTAGT